MKVKSVTPNKMFRVLEERAAADKRILLTLYEDSLMMDILLFEQVGGDFFAKRIYFNDKNDVAISDRSCCLIIEFTSKYEAVKYALEEMNPEDEETVAEFFGENYKDLKAAVEAADRMFNKIRIAKVNFQDTGRLSGLYPVLE